MKPTGFHFFSSVGTLCRLNVKQFIVVYSRINIPFKENNLKMAYRSDKVKIKVKPGQIEAEGWTGVLAQGAVGKSMTF